MDLFGRMRVIVCKSRLQFRLNIKEFLTKHRVRIVAISRVGRESTERIKS
jgi:hypothetical protein